MFPISVAPGGKWSWENLSIGATILSEAATPSVFALKSGLPPMCRTVDGLRDAGPIVPVADLMTDLEPVERFSNGILPN